MYSECRHILPSGRKCKSPALTGHDYCYFHDRLERFRANGTAAHNEPIQLPPLEDARGLQMALTQVLSAFGSGRITSKQAGMYLYGIQLAMQMLKHATAPAPIETVRDLHCSKAGTWIGAEKQSCDPFVDCAACKTKDTCLNAARLNMRSMHQILRAMRKGQQQWEEQLDEAEQPTPQNSPAQNDESETGASAEELEEDIYDFFLENPNQEEGLDLRELIDPGHLYNIKRAQPRT